AFVIENCNSLTAAAGLGSMLADTVEAEQANDLLEVGKVPRITRLAAANVLEEPDEQPREEYDGLVDASAAGAQKVVSFVEKSWEPSLPYGVDCFAKAPFDIIGGISQLTNTTLYYDDNNTRIVVSGNRSDDVDAAMQKLSNLEMPMPRGRYQSAKEPTPTTTYLTRKKQTAKYLERFQSHGVR
ncbi:hypothetical protein KEM55_001919, partial [Ascosphaera atra]